MDKELKKTLIACVKERDFRSLTRVVERYESRTGEAIDVNIKDNASGETLLNMAKSIVG